MTQREAEKLLAEWQTRLRLKDWNLRVRLDPKLDCYGRNRGHTWYQDGEIVLKPSDSIPEDWKESCQDLEVTLVHELLHCHLSPITDRAKEDSFEVGICEKVIEMCAQALVAAKRGLIRIDDAPSKVGKQKGSKRKHQARNRSRKAAKAGRSNRVKRKAASR